jgi:ribosomal protein S18 acetylase RimI-like enzyme
MKSIQVFPLCEHHRSDWQLLAEGYKAFYKTPTSGHEYELAWARLMAGNLVRGLGASVDGDMVGIAHFIHHASTWANQICYLQDLFTAPKARGQGVAKTLIEAVAAHARQSGASRLYWLTQENNAVARKLYERVASFNGFIRYDFSL